MATDGKKNKTIFREPSKVINHNNCLCKQEAVKESLIWPMCNVEEKIAECCTSDDSQKCQMGLQREK